MRLSRAYHEDGFKDARYIKDDQHIRCATNWASHRSGLSPSCESDSVHAGTTERIEAVGIVGEGGSLRVDAQGGR